MAWIHYQPNNLPNGPPNGQEAMKSHDYQNAEPARLGFGPSPQLSDPSQSPSDHHHQATDLRVITKVLLPNTPLLSPLSSLSPRSPRSPHSQKVGITKSEYEKMFNVKVEPDVWGAASILLNMKHSFDDEMTARNHRSGSSDTVSDHKEHPQAAMLSPEERTQQTTSTGQDQTMPNGADQKMPTGEDQKMKMSNGKPPPKKMSKGKRSHDMISVSGEHPQETTADTGNHAQETMTQSPVRRSDRLRKNGRSAIFK